MGMMPIEAIPDWEMRLARQDAMWQGEIIDRPVVHIILPKKNPVHPWPQPRTWAGVRDQWFDAEYRAECALAGVMNTEWLGDALPYTWPNLGPEVFSSYFGCDIEYSETTSWAIPNLHDWSDTSHIEFSTENEYWKKTIEMLDALMEVGRGRFYTNFTDLHAGGDAVAAFRDPQQLCIDLIESPDDVKALLKRVTDAYLQTLDFFHDKLLSAGQAVGTGGNCIQSSKRWHYVANDFAYMVSREMYDDIFLPEIIREVEHLEACYYHLDGEGNLRHLDSLLEVPGIDMIQWVPSPWNGPSTKWMDLYKRCQAAGKGLQIGIHVDDLDCFMENLKPAGLAIIMEGVQDSDHAEAVIRRIEGWR